MQIRNLNPIILAVTMTAFVGWGAEISARQPPQENQKHEEVQKGRHDKDQKDRAEKRHPQRKDRGQQKAEDLRQPQRKDHKQLKAEQRKDQNAEHRQRLESRHQHKAEHKTERKAERQEQKRLSQQQQQQLITQQQQRVVQYRRHLQEQRRLDHKHSAQLQQEKRMAQYRLQQRYLERLRQQQISIENDHHHDFRNDPYFYTPSSHRYLRGGRYYETNRYGVKLLRRAVNAGYEEGCRAGDADRRDRWTSSYRDSYAYRDANYGYDGYYLDRRDYNHYFREGFRRGYEDGYGSRSQYGSASNGKYSMLGNVLSGILNLQPLR